MKSTDRNKSSAKRAKGRLWELVNRLNNVAATPTVENVERLEEARHEKLGQLRKGVVEMMKSSAININGTTYVPLEEAITHARAILPMAMRYGAEVATHPNQPQREHHE